MATLPSGDISVANSITHPSTTNAQQKTNWSNLIQFIKDLFGTDSSIAVNAERVSGLVGAVNATTPLTKFDLSANVVVLRNAAVNTVVRRSTGSLTCDLGLSGPAANGRDQSAAFTANSWIYIYFIWNGSTLATLASATAPASFTGSTLPTGYTHWCFAAAIRWNGSSNIIPVFVKGAKVFYDLANGGTRVLANGQATAMTAVSCSSFVPPIAQAATLKWLVQCTHNAAGVEFSGLYRVTGSSHVGEYAVAAMSQVANVILFVVSRIETPLNASQQFDYKIANVPSTSGGVTVDVIGYTVSNGDA